VREQRVVKPILGRGHNPFTQKIQELTKETMMRNETIKIVEDGVIFDELSIEEVEEVVAPAVVVTA
jgi:hypothetical protein